jgi:hypothetical protein
MPNPGGPITTGPQAKPQAQVSQLPNAARYVPVDSVSRSADGRTLYLQIEAQSGVCGNYDVVLQESGSQVRVGVAHLAVKVGVMCPMIVRRADFPVWLAAPLAGRQVIDLATGTSLGPIGVAGALGAGAATDPSNPVTS